MVLRDPYRTAAALISEAKGGPLDRGSGAATNGSRSRSHLPQRRSTNWSRRCPRTARGRRGPEVRLDTSSRPGPRRQPPHPLRLRERPMGPVSAAMGEEWRTAQSRALGVCNETLKEGCEAALRLYGISAHGIRHLLKARQERVVRHALGLAVTDGRGPSLTTCRRSGAPGRERRGSPPRRGRRWRRPAERRCW